MALLLAISILLRGLALGLSVWMIRRTRDWRMGFLTLMLGFMTLRQILTLRLSDPSSPFSMEGAATELPGLVVSLMTFLMVYFLSRLLERQKQVEVALRCEGEARVKALADLEEKVREIGALNLQLTERQEELASYHDLVTHDVTNFTGTLRLIVEQLRKVEGEPLSARRDLLVRRAERQIFELQRLADNARTLVRLRLQGLPPPVGTVGLLASIERILETLRTVHFDRPFTVDLQIPGELHAAGLPLLDNLFLNILDNAIRHSPRESAPRLKVSAAADAGSVLLRVRGGQPLDPDELQGIFGRYRPGRRSSGSGLALSVVHAIVTRAGGTVEARTSTDGAAPEFELVLKLPGA